MQGMITDPKNALNFILSGRATVTLVSKKTGLRFTYKVRKNHTPLKPGEKPLYFVSLLTGPDNTTSYQSIGIIAQAKNFHITKKAKALGISDTTPSVLALRWVLDFLIIDRIPATVEIWHEGRCGVCNRPLTVPESIATGIGPLCITKLWG